MTAKAQSGQEKVWVFGKVEPGWYMARAVPDRQYADHLKSLGYQVQVSPAKPDVVA